MALHSVFDPAGSPPWTVDVFTDGTPSIRLGNYFYTVSGAEGWQCSGGRVWIPYDSNVQNKAIHIFAYVVAGSQVDLSASPWRETVTTTPMSGWCEVSWTPIPLSLAPAQFLFIGYEITGNSGAYLAVSQGTVGTGSRNAWDGSQLALAETFMSPYLGDGANRGQFRIGTGGSDAGSPWYGVDAVLDTAVVSGRSGKPKIWTGTAWEQHPAKIWTGTAWEIHPMKGYNGSDWIEAK